MIRRRLRFALTVAGLLFRRPLISVSVTPIDAEGRIVLARRRDNGRWSLPGGLVDWGETLEECAARELEEEVGLRLTRVERVIGVYSDIERDPRVHSIAVAMAAQVEGAPRVADPDEILETRAFTTEEIEREIGLDGLSHDHGRHFGDYLSGREATLA